MTHLFAPYELALLAKMKGFDEPCFGLYNQIKELCYPQLNYNEWKSFDVQKDDDPWITKAPLYQQLVDWFASHHNLHIEPASSYDETGTVSKQYRVLQITPPHIKIKYQGKEALFSYRDFKVDDLITALQESFKLLP